MIKRMFWKIIRFSYIQLAKPILFLQAPDDVHSAMIRFARHVGSVTILRKFVRLIFFVKPDARLTQEYYGVTFQNPVGLSAGFDKNGEIVPAIAALGFGFSEVGSVTAHQCDGNTRPWFYRLPKTGSLVVRAGLPNSGSSRIIKRLAAYTPHQLPGFPIVLSVAKTNSRAVVNMEVGIADYVTSVKRARNQKNIQMIELNISCPNAYGGEPFTTPDRLTRLLAAVDAANPTQPVFIKMPGDLSWPEFDALLAVISRHNVKGVTIANLTKDRSTVKTDETLPDTISGGLSGAPTRQRNNELIRQTYLAYGDSLTIIGVGGIFSADDAYEKIRLGASLVELITGMIFYGPQLVAEINAGLLRCLERDGYTHISQAIGVDTYVSIK